MPVSDSQRGLYRRIYQKCDILVRGLSCFLYEVNLGVTSDSQWRLEWKDLPSLRRLGRGLSGFVYETIWEGKKYARKDFPLGSDKDKLVFRNEAKFLFYLDHSNIVKCYGYTVGKSSCSLLQEYVDDNLQDTIQKRTEAAQIRSKLENSTLPFGVPEAVDIISQIATAMEYLHEHQVVHGDLKPKNVLVFSEAAEAGTKMIVKVADYGLVETKKLIKLESEQTRQIDALMWKAPELFSTVKTGIEQAKALSEHLEYDSLTTSGTDSDEDEETASNSDEFLKSRLAMADVYSFGLTCAHILSGKLINSAKERMKCDFEPELPSACPSNLKVLIYRCLKFEALSRPTFRSVRAEMTSKYSHIPPWDIVIPWDELCDTSPTPPDVQKNPMLQESRRLYSPN
ncbi:hypothetical protein M758_2G111100 [Ceratodon purpureus]|nr:hypothetical protein M758_2G111100 [Ceratodon purpureus]